MTDIEVRDGDVIFTTHRVSYSGNVATLHKSETVSLKQLIRNVFNEQGQDRFFGEAHELGGAIRVVVSDGFADD